MSKRIPFGFYSILIFFIKNILKRKKDLVELYIDVVFKYKVGQIYYDFIVVLYKIWSIEDSYQSISTYLERKGNYCHYSG